MSPNGEQIKRRKFLKISSLTLLAGFMPGVALAAFQNRPSKERSLSFYNTHTGESLNTVYWAHGDYIAESLQTIDVIMRDHRTGDILSMDPKLLDLVHTIKCRLHTKEPFHIISGYRSPKTNAFLNRCTTGVAKNSFHLYGKAVDIRLPGCRLSHLRDVALDMGMGGVGYYPRPRFVHVDIGPVRYW